MLISQIGTFLSTKILSAAFLIDLQEKDNAYFQDQAQVPAEDNMQLSDNPYDGNTIHTKQKASKNFGDQTAS